MTAEITQIGKYKIVDVLGRGAMGVVYKGFDPMIERHVAIKTIVAPDDPDHADEIRTRFKREAQAAGNLNHPGIVSIYEYGEDAGLAYIVMECVQGPTLSDRMKQNEPLTVEQSAHIIKSVLAAVSHAHDMGVVHRDIKPGNIMLADNGAVKVTDFGVARVESSELTRTGTLIGTPGYMSPEQLKGETIDARSDLFSTGVILYEMLTGQRAFGGSTIASVIYKVINQELPPPSRLRETIPAGLDAVVAKAVAKTAAARFQTAQQFIEAVDAAARPYAQRAPAPESRGAAHLKAEDKPTVIEQPAEKTIKRGPVFAMGAVAVLAALVIGFLMRPGPEDKQTMAVAQPKPGEVFQDCDSCPSLVVIPPGSFIQGTSPSVAAAHSNEAPVRLVSIDDAFAAGRYEVTRKEYAAFIADTGNSSEGCMVYDGRWQFSENMSWRRPGFDQDDNHPVTCISWEDARVYTQWLSRKTSQTYRLLSASEWEYIARDGGRAEEVGRTPPEAACTAGNVADLDAAGQYPGWQVVNCSDNYVHTAPVGSYTANALGVFDLTGNVFEWVGDCWNDDYKAAPTDGSAWNGGDCRRRVLRGGSWFSRPQYLRAAFRNRFDADLRSSSFGFRVARELKP